MPVWAAPVSSKLASAHSAFKIASPADLCPPITSAAPSFHPAQSPDAPANLEIFRHSNNFQQFPLPPLAIAPADRQAFAAQGPRAPPLPAHLYPGAGPQRGHCRRPRPRRLHRRVLRSRWCLWSRILYFLSVTLQSLLEIPVVLIEAKRGGNGGRGDRR